jgi:hypothetical protein
LLRLDAQQTSQVTERKLTTTMNPSPRQTRSNRRRMLLIAAVIFISYCYFYEGGGWNQNSRFDMVRAILEQKTLSIDTYHENTQDKALSHGRYYSDKAPGLAFLALPVALSARPMLRVVGVDPLSPRGLQITSYDITVFAVALPTALACGCLFLIALQLGSNVSGAAFASLGMGLATPMWAYATLLWGHALAGACLVFGFAAALMLRESRGGTSDLVRGLVVGLFAGWATVSEYPAAPGSAILAVLALAIVWRDGPARRWRVFSGVSAGALACIAVLMFYQYRAFGSAIHPSYSYYQEGAFPWMKHGYMGLTYPRIDVMLKLLFGCRRGLFFAAPALILAPFGLRILWKNKNPEIRYAGVAATSIAVYYFLFNASFSVWAGGWSYGPRYMAAGIPLLCVGLAPGWSALGTIWRRIFAALAVCGSLFALMAVSTTPQPDDQFHCPLMQVMIPSFWAGKLALTRGSMLTAAEDIPFGTHGAFNLGQLVGLHGLASLIPLLVVWGLAFMLWKRLDSASAMA